VPKQGVPRSPKLLVQVEWAQTPVNNGINAFYLQARKKYWVLWLRTFDDNSYPWQWNWQAIGYCCRTNVDKGVAAKHLLLEYWKFTGDPDENSVDDQLFDWINEEGLLSIADVRAIVRELNRQQKTKEMTPEELEAFAQAAKKHTEAQPVRKLTPKEEALIQSILRDYPTYTREELIKEMEDEGWL
jgi:hypothetical protein